MELQEALKRLRDELSLTQTQLAEKLGVSYVTISRWENGKVVPNMRVAAEGGDGISIALSAGWAGSPAA